VPILEETFGRELRALCKRFNREWDADLLDRYYSYLGARLNDHEFVAASQHLYATAQFFPRPEDFLDAVPERDRITGISPKCDPYQPIVTQIAANSPQHRRWKATLAQRRMIRAAEGVDYWTDARGIKCTVRSRHFADDEGRGFPIPTVEVVEP
jgi:hypothetical protein